MVSECSGFVFTKVRASVCQNLYDLGFFLKTSSGHALPFQILMKRIDPYCPPDQVQVICDLTPASGFCRTHTYSTFQPNQHACSTHPAPCCVSHATAHAIPLSRTSLPPPFTSLHCHIQILPAPEACSDNVSQIKPSQILFLHLNSVPQAIFSKNTIS